MSLPRKARVSGLNFRLVSPPAQPSTTSRQSRITAQGRRVVTSQSQSSARCPRERVPGPSAASGAFTCAPRSRPLRRVARPKTKSSLYSAGSISEPAVFRAKSVFTAACGLATPRRSRASESPSSRFTVAAS